MLRQPVCDARPRLAVVARAEDVWRVVADSEQVEHGEGFGRVEVRRFDREHLGALDTWNTGDARVAPRLAAIARNLDQAVVRADPDQPGHDRGERHRLNGGVA